MRKINCLFALASSFALLTTTSHADEIKLFQTSTEKETPVLESTESSEEDLEEIDNDIEKVEIPVEKLIPILTPAPKDEPTPLITNDKPLVQPTEKPQLAPQTPPKKAEDAKNAVIAPIQVKNNIEPFTGRITKNKVRLRLQPNFEGTNVKELNQGELVVVYGTTDDFYAVKPPKEQKAYIYRTYVLDNVVEGTRVNVRLKPDLDSPVVAQLNSGDRVEGKIYADNNKWLEINMPEVSRFYIAKEYVEKIGDANFKAQQEKRQDEVYRLLATTKAIGDAEMLKPFDKIVIEGIVANYKRIILDYKDFPDATTKAQEYLNALQNAYTTKKLAFLEQQSLDASQLQKQNRELSDELEQNRNRISQLQNQMQSDKRSQSQFTTPAHDVAKTPSSELPVTMATWMPIENSLFTTWTRETGKDNPLEFYEEQKRSSFNLKGIVEVYNRPVKNKPGDFMLVDTTTKLPIAYLYSTQVNLQNFIGHDVTINVAPRNNFNYAFPAYFVLSIE